MVTLKIKILCYPVIKFINKNYVFCFPSAKTQMNLHALESNWIPILENEDILTKLNKTLFSILGQLGLLNNLGYASKKVKLGYE